MAAIDLSGVRLARAAEQIAKAPGARTRARHETRVATRATALAAQVERLLRAYGLQLFYDHRRSLLRGKVPVRKRLTRAELEREMLDLLTRFGLAQSRDAANSVGEWEFTPTLWREVEASRRTKVVLLIEETDTMVRESLQRLIGEATREVPRPTQAEVARRIARTWFGGTTSEAVRRGSAEERRSTADWRRGKPAPGVTPDFQESIFSFERASTIARTELAASENVGIVAGLTAAGFKTASWSARPFDGRSGKRAHHRLNGETIEIEAITEKDVSRYFTTPLGNRMPYPGWHGGPVADLANCRCFLVGRA